MKSIYLHIIEHQHDKLMPVLATVVRTKGSTPQKPGSSALFDNQSVLAGTVGGGVVESRIQHIASERIYSGKSGYYQFNLANDISKKEEAICGGTITILVDADLRAHLPVLTEISQSINENIPGVLITEVSGFEGNEVSVKRYWMSSKTRPSLDSSVMSVVEPAVSEMLAAADPSSFREIDFSDIGRTTFLYLEPVLPPLNLLIAGAGHIGRALAKIGNMLGFEVTVIDDRQDYANHENIPDASGFIVKEVATALRELRKTPDKYLVIVTRGHKDDAAALKACLGSELAYIGMIGSRRKIVAMRSEFIEKGFATPEQWDSIYSPIGLEINSQTVEEIAVSIAAQIILVKNSRKAKNSACPA